MEKRTIAPSALPAPRGFSHAIATRGGTTVYLAGQDGAGPDGRIVAGGLLPQFEQVLRNLAAVVADAGGELADVVKLNVYTTDVVAYRLHLEALGEIFRRFFGGVYPAMALFEVHALFREEAVIEMEGIAVIGDGAPGAP